MPALSQFGGPERRNAGKLPFVPSVISSVAEMPKLLATMNMMAPVAGLVHPGALVFSLPGPCVSQKRGSCLRVSISALNRAWA